ncbi:hypothetical protein ACHAXS_002520 [Conticribra weissflogii]
MYLLKEFKVCKFKTTSTEPNVYCKVFEDNSGTLELAKLPKLRPCTKHINMCYHHFREHARNGLIKIFLIGMHDQIADIFRKPLPETQFKILCKKLCGW